MVKLPPYSLRENFTPFFYACFKTKDNNDVFLKGFTKILQCTSKYFLYENVHPRYVPISPPHHTVHLPLSVCLSTRALSGLLNCYVILLKIAYKCSLTDFNMHLYNILQNILDFTNNTYYTMHC